MSTLRSQYPIVFENIQTFQSDLFINKSQLIAFNVYNIVTPTTTLGCIASYENQQFQNTNLGSLPLPMAISTTILEFLNNIVARFSDHVRPLDLFNGEEFLYFILDYNAIQNAEQFIYCGITNDMARRSYDHLKSTPNPQFYKHILSSSLFIVGFSLKMNGEAITDLKTLCIHSMMTFSRLTALDVLFNYTFCANISIPVLYKRFCINGIFIANNQAFFISDSLIQLLQNRKKHGFLKYLLTKTNERFYLVVKGVQERVKINNSTAFCLRDQEYRSMLNCD